MHPGRHHHVPPLILRASPAHPAPPCPCPRPRARRPLIPGVEGLEGRWLLALGDPSLSSLLKTLGQGVADIQNRSGTIADAAFGLDLPMLKDTLGSTFNVGGALAGSLPKTITPTDVLNDARS